MTEPIQDLTTSTCWCVPMLHQTFPIKTGTTPRMSIDCNTFFQHHSEDQTRQIRGEILS
jgi:hypothetical protein